LDGVNDVLCAPDCLALVKRGLNGGRRPILSDELLTGLARGVEAHWVDLHERRRGAGQFWEVQDVYHEPTRPHHAAGTDKCDFH
jgi:hypothetical protein